MTTEAGYPQRSSAGLKIAFVAGIEDPFYYNMQRGALQAVESLGATLLSQFPQDWSAAEQIQIIDNLSSGDELDALLLVPTDPLALIPSLQKVADAGLPILALDTSLDASFTPLSCLKLGLSNRGVFRLPFPGASHWREREGLYPERKPWHCRYRCPRARLPEGAERVPWDHPGGSQLQR